MKFWQVGMVVGLLLLISLNQSLWLDEAISANTAKNYGYKEIVSKFSQNDFHPPVYYLLLKTWTGVAGNSEIALRLLSVIFTLITVYLVYQLGGAGAAMMAGFNPLLVYYSQEARMYSLITMLLTGVVYCFVKKKYLWLNILAGLALVTFYGSVFLLAALSLYLLVNKRFKEIILINIGPVVALILIWPLITRQMNNSREMLFAVQNWDLVLGKVNIKNILLIPLKFTSGRISFYPKIIYYLVAGAFAGFTFLKLFKKNIYAFIFWATLGIGIIFSVFTPMLQYFRFLYLIPIMALMIHKNRFITAGFLIFSLVYLLNPGFHREDWKGVSNDLKNEVYMVASFGDPVKYYRPEVKINDIRETINGEKIQVIPYGEAIHGVDHKQILESKNYRLVETKNYREISLEYWQQKY